ncbi:MAG: hypothetical protein ABSA97_04495 [Verrucomicrobiia bacterium]
MGYPRRNRRNKHKRIEVHAIVIRHRRRLIRNTGLVESPWCDFKKR